MTYDEATGRHEATAACLASLEAGGQTLGTAESLTAGLVAATFATVPGASNVLRGGIAAYAVDVKTDVLGADPDVIARHGVYSRECAVAMAVAARGTLRCDWSVATTGVAGPDPDDGHPAGEVHVAVAGPDAVVVSRRLDLAGTRQQIRTGSVDAVIGLLHETLRAHDGR
jgi:nicotinamide-nucleotide amidase